MKTTRCNSGKKSAPCPLHIELGSILITFPNSLLPTSPSNNHILFIFSLYDRSDFICVSHKWDSVDSVFSTSGKKRIVHKTLHDPITLQQTRWVCVIYKVQINDKFSFGLLQQPLEIQFRANNSTSLRQLTASEL